MIGGIIICTIVAFIIGFVVGIAAVIGEPEE